METFSLMNLVNHLSIISGRLAITTCLEIDCLHNSEVPGFVRPLIPETSSQAFFWQGLKEASLEIEFRLFSLKH